MTIADAKNLSRAAQRLIVEARRAYGSPPVYDTLWQPVWGAKVDRIEIKKDSQPSTAVIWFPDLRWEQTRNLFWGDMVRIRTNERLAAERTIVFQGFLTNYLSEFSGGTEQPNTAFERNAITCQSYRWLLSVTSPVVGQRARGPDDYLNYGTIDQSPKDDSYIHATGRRAIFNAGGKPNRDPSALTREGYGDIPIFTDSERAEYWTARDMLCYILSHLNNRAYRYLPIPDPAQLTGLDHFDWDRVLNHIVVDGLNVLEAVQLICRHLGWSFREDYENDGAVALVFYKPGAAFGYSRQNTTILHYLHAPRVSENIADAVAEGKKMLWSMTLAEDIGAIVNWPLGLGAPHRFEFTAELVPAWLDDDLEPDTSEANANLFFTEAELQELTDPDSKSYYKNYHPRGSQFSRNVGRKWALNESGHYSVAPRWVRDKYYEVDDLVNNGVHTYKCLVPHLSELMNQPPRGSRWQKTDGYDRGMPFDFSGCVPPQYIFDAEGKRLFAPFNRCLLPCLTVNKDTLTSVGTKLEFSFDAGESWQIILAATDYLKDECGIYIDEPNLADLVDQNEGAVSEEEEEKKLQGLPLNYWTSLCGDKLWERKFKDKDSEAPDAKPWKTRIRITASVQMDRRLARQSPPSPVSITPFDHSQIYDFSEKCGLTRRDSSSVFSVAGMPVRQVDSTDRLDGCLQAIRKANEDMSVSGQFTLERLWLGDGSGWPDFALGDCIEKITGREHDLSVAFGDGVVYPEIIQIIYLPDRQRMKLITRDLRFAEVAVV